MSLPAILSRNFKVFLLCLSLILGLSLHSALTPHTFAQTSINTTDSSTAPDVSENSHTHMQIQMIEFSSALVCQLIGIDIINPNKGCLGVNPVTKQISYSPTSQTKSPQVGGILGMVVGGISSTYQPVVTTTQFTHYLASNFGLAKPINAQEKDSGSFGSFTFLQDVFVALRNLTFSLFVILFILIGIAIMLRLKIDPRTVMSIQNQLPKIVISIILISFSYAIAGLLTDGMWVMTFFGINTIGSIAQQECPVIPDGSSNDNTIIGVASQSLYNNPMWYTHNLFNTNSCFGNGHWSGLSGLSYQVGSSIGDILTSTILKGIGADLSDISSHKSCGFFDYLSGGISDCIKADVFQFTSFIVGIIGFLIVLIAILLALVRVWFTLIKAYVYIILDVVTAPLQIGAGLIPSSTFGFMRWFRHILAYLLVFPAVATLLVFASIFALNPAINSVEGTNTLTAFIPPFIGNPFMQNNLGALIAFGIILITPELLELIKESLKVKSSDRATKAIIGGFTRGVAPVGALGGIGTELFGKDKAGNPRALRRIVGNKWAEKTRPNEFLGRAKYSPVRIWRRSQQSQELTRRENMAQNPKYGIEQALHAYNEYYVRHPGDHDGAMLYADPFLRKAGIESRGPNSDFYDKFVAQQRSTHANTNPGGKPNAPVSQGGTAAGGAGQPSPVGAVAQATTARTGATQAGQAGVAVEVEFRGNDLVESTSGRIIGRKNGNMFDPASGGMSVPVANLGPWLHTGGRNYMLKNTNP